jgi:hypothetical protein
MSTATKVALGFCKIRIPENARKPEIHDCPPFVFPPETGIGGNLRTQQTFPYRRPSDPPHDGEEGRSRARAQEEEGREEVMGVS